MNDAEPLSSLECLKHDTLLFVGRSDHPKVVVVAPVLSNSLAESDTHTLRSLEEPLANKDVAIV